MTRHSQPGAWDGGDERPPGNDMGEVLDEQVRFLVLYSSVSSGKIAAPEPMTQFTRNCSTSITR